MMSGVIWMNEERKICPLLSITSPTGMCPCLREKCMWYRYDDCAIAWIMYSLKAESGVTDEDEDML
jgi:hypothetical protein